ncbi:hypothetical protein GGD66_000663 [Bradyrhizobium sp. CIR48]|uniref:hypothetical protein n=1 Tax=unclassified Bradyrhizobium TaxID=2631580 RepID=UPI000B830A16|nr:MULTISPECIES: hypothetical protein [unclassified Bradyrhizobium]MBB4378200.1 hypothetical protein [Bradyrhizobium sp. SBR1B]MBB4422137.1 hypothetical protein [Bradyrhizobium sp. CIR48]
MAEDKVMLGDGDAEHHHDDQDEPQSAPVGLSRRALRFPASRADRERPIGISVSQNSQIIGASMMKSTGSGVGRGNAGHRLIRPVNAKVGRFVPVATTRCTWQAAVAFKEKPRAFARGSSG